MGHGDSTAEVNAGQMMKNSHLVIHNYKRILRNLFYRFDKLKKDLIKYADDEQKEDKLLKRLSKLQTAIKQTKEMIKEIEKDSGKREKSLSEL